MAYYNLLPTLVTATFLAVYDGNYVAAQFCPKCPGLYVANCNGLTDRRQCYTAAQAKVKRAGAPSSCALTYVCPEPLVAYGWPRAAGSPMQAIAGGRLTCTAAYPFWRTPGLAGMRQITCMSRPQTRTWFEQFSSNVLEDATQQTRFLSSRLRYTTRNVRAWTRIVRKYCREQLMGYPSRCVDVYQEKKPCGQTACAPRKNVALRVYRDPSNANRCILDFTCPAGTQRYIYEAVGKGYVPMLDNNPITCVDNGPGSSWTTVMAPPYEIAYVQYVTCFSRI